MKKKLMYTTLIFLTLLLFLFIGFLLKRQDVAKGFQRKITNHNYKVNNIYRLPPALLYFAGFSNDNIYLKDLHLGKASLFSIDHSLSKLSTVNLNLSTDEKNKKSTVGITDTSQYVIDNESGKLAIVKKLGNSTFTIKKTKSYINQAALISGQSVVAREILMENKEPIMNLIKLDYSKSVTVKTYSFENKNCFFCSDGKLQYDSNTKKLFYMYYYVGKFLCLDTNLNVLYEAKTIDTVTQAKINTAKIKKGINQEHVALTQTVPPKLANKNFAIHNNRIYVLSALRSDNQDKTIFRDHETIDIYSAINGSYLESLEVPKYEGMKLRDFRIEDNFIFAIFDRVIVKYRLSNAIG